MWAGVGVRKGGGSVVLGLPPGSEPPDTQAKARILLADAPQGCVRCHNHTNRAEA